MFVSVCPTCSLQNPATTTPPHTHTHARATHPTDCRYSCGGGFEEQGCTILPHSLAIPVARTPHAPPFFLLRFLFSPFFLLTIACIVAVALLVVCPYEIVLRARGLTSFVTCTRTTHIPTHPHTPIALTSLPPPPPLHPTPPHTNQDTCAHTRTHSKLVLRPDQVLSLLRVPHVLPRKLLSLPHSCSPGALLHPPPHHHTPPTTVVFCTALTLHNPLQRSGGVGYLLQGVVVIKPTQNRRKKRGSRNKEGKKEQKRVGVEGIDPPIEGAEELVFGCCCCFY